MLDSSRLQGRRAENSIAEIAFWPLIFLLGPLFLAEALLYFFRQTPLEILETPETTSIAHGRLGKLVARLAASPSA